MPRFTTVTADRSYMHVRLLTLAPNWIIIERKRTGTSSSKPKDRCYYAARSILTQLFSNIYDMLFGHCLLLLTQLGLPSNCKLISKCTEVRPFGLHSLVSLTRSHCPQGLSPGLRCLTARGMRPINGHNSGGQQRTLLKRREGIVSLLVRLRLIERDPNGDKVLAWTSVCISTSNWQPGEELSHRERCLE